MTYLWINPVSERMVSEQNLKRILTEHQLTQVRCQEDWGGIVLKQYAELIVKTGANVQPGQKVRKVSGGCESDRTIQ